MGRAERKLLFILVVLGAFFAASPGSGQRVKSSGERKILSRGAVVYPKIAQHLGLRGTVKVMASVAPSGKVVKTELVGGSPVFVPNALDAVALMKFEAAQTETQELIQVDFLPRERD